MATKSLGASAAWETASWNEAFSPQTLNPFTSQTTGTHFEDLPNFYDVRAWILNSSDFFQLVLFTLTWVFVSKHAIAYFQRKAADLNVDPKDRLRFANSTWKAIFYSLSFSWGLLLAYFGNYYPETANCWAGFPNVNYVFSLDSFYMMEMGFYLYSVYALFDVEEKRSDAILLLLHHGITISLIYSSNMVRLKPLGVLVLVVHDFSDIFLELAKSFGYRKKEPHKTICFVSLVFSWAIGRLWIYPFHIIGSLYAETPLHVPVDKMFVIWVYFLIFFSTLCLMHVYWFFLILRIVYKKVVLGKEVTDDREHEQPRSFKQE